MNKKILFVLLTTTAGFSYAGNGSTVHDEMNLNQIGVISQASETNGLVATLNLENPVIISYGLDQTLLVNPTLASGSDTVFNQQNANLTNHGGTAGGGSGIPQGGIVGGGNATILEEQGSSGHGRASKQFGVITQGEQSGGGFSQDKESVTIQGEQSGGGFSGEKDSVTVQGEQSGGGFLSISYVSSEVDFYNLVEKIEAVRGNYLSSELLNAWAGSASKRVLLVVRENSNQLIFLD